MLKWICTCASTIRVLTKAVQAAELYLLNSTTKQAPIELLALRKTFFSDTFSRNFIKEVETLLYDFRVIQELDVALSYE